MKKQQFTKSQIMQILKQAEGGIPVANLCREYGMSNASFYKWRSTLCCWAEKRGIQLNYIQPGKPQQNANKERYNRTVRHEWLEMNGFATIQEAQLTATQWLWIYNNERLSRALGGITPAMKLAEAFKLKPSTANSC